MGHFETFNFKHAWLISNAFNNKAKLSYDLANKTGFIK